MTDLRWELRAFELSLPREKRKRLGQFFTEPAVARLIAALCIRSPKTRVLDPMAGHGSLLDAAAERIAMTNGHADLFGVEIDLDTARLCQSRMAACVHEYRQRSVHVTCGSAFSEPVWHDLGADERFDLVIGNPPYVRYQTSKGTRDEVRNALRRIAERYAPEVERDLWRTLIDGYSGLADLSVPSWILCSILCQEHGLLALVVPRTWMNRDYARLIRYMQLRFFEPLFLVEEHGVGWFEDAVVPTTLVVSRRLPPDAVLVPLHARGDCGNAMLRIGIPVSAGKGDASLVANAFPGPDPEGAFAAWAAGNAAPLAPFSVQRETLADQRSRVLAAVRSDTWARSAEGGFRVATSSARPDARSLIPAPFARALHFPPDPNLVTLTTAGVKIGQGLRTGCNAFFYVDEVDAAPDAESVTVRVSNLFKSRTFDVPRAVLRPALRRQSEVTAFRLRTELLRGRVLDLRQWLLPEDDDALQGHLFPSRRSHRMPEVLAHHVRTAAITTMGRDGQAAPIPQLSAVAPNERTNDAGPRRRWYMLPDFAPRHLPLAFVPRVNDGTPWFVGNAAEPVLVDANFSTLYDRGALPTLPALLAILNSTWVRTCCEAIGSPMGGGALKLEATHLREVPIPLPRPECLEKLDRLGEALAGAELSQAEPIISAIDQLTVGAIIGEPCTTGAVANASNALRTLLNSLRHQRQRKGIGRA